MTVTLSHRAQRDDNASPRNPNDVRVVSDDNEVSFEV